MPINIPAHTPVSLNCPATETSGLTVVINEPNQNALYVVCDNGGWGRFPLPYSASSTWFTSPATNKADKSDDYECVAFAGNTQLVLFGVEGYRDPNNTGVLSPPRVLQFSSVPTPGHFGSLSWSLNLPASGGTVNSGMEALTSLPGSSVPASWLVPNTLLVLMAVQSVNNRAYLYPLPTNGASPVTKTQTLNLPPIPEAPSVRISELYFDVGRSVLFVLYDGGGSLDYLQAVRFTVAGSGVTLTSINIARMPWTGCEGMAVYGDDLYFATDEAGGTHNGVYRVANFINGFLAGGA